MIALGPWIWTTCADRRVVGLADRHYPRQGRPDLAGGRTVGPPGERLVFVTEDGRAAWITSRQKPETVKHAWPGALVNSFFRNEGRTLSSQLITAAVERTCVAWGALPPRGIITFVDAEKTKRRRSKRSLPGECYRRAGWLEIGVTGGGAWTFRARSARVRAGGAA